MQKPTQRRLGALVLLALLGLLAACGGNDTTQGSHDAETGHNDADVAFASDMIPHHAQAIEMAKMAASKAISNDVVGLARQIQDAQQPEIDTMTSWLNTWGEPVPDTSMAGMDHGSMGDDAMAGMMSANDMRQLNDAAGATFDQLWLQMMIKHHQGAIEMAKTELEDGQNTDSKALAQQIIDAQQTEITTMNGLL